MERVAIQDLLQSYNEGNYVTFKVLGELRNKVGFNSEEVKEFDIKQTGNNVTWNEKGNTPREFTLNEMEVNLVRDQLIAKDKANKLIQLYLSIYEMFV